MPDPLQGAGAAGAVQMHLEQAPAARPAAARDSAAPGRGERPDEPEGAAQSAFGEALREAGRSIAQGKRYVDRAVHAAHRGKSFSHEELIALQAGVYRYTHELELASKLVDKSTSAVRQTLQSQR